ncbi:hypothetical protein JW868_02205 [Candidatus Woesearchaeota archaeon]|nr:hypothetical protein [Candidatus Woesearchaeota archaeon]
MMKKDSKKTGRREQTKSEQVKSKSKKENAKQEKMDPMDEKGTGTYKTPEGKIMQLFGLRIYKEIDPKTKNVQMEIKSQTRGLPVPEALLLVEGWLETEKKKMLDPIFHGQKNVKKDEKP